MYLSFLKLFVWEARSTVTPVLSEIDWCNDFWDVGTIISLFSENEKSITVIDSVIKMMTLTRYR